MSSSAPLMQYRRGQHHSLLRTGDSTRYLRRLDGDECDRPSDMAALRCGTRAALVPESFLRLTVEKLAALPEALARYTPGSGCPDARLPDGQAKLRILRAVDRARECIPLRAVLRFMRLSPSRFQAWRRRQHACALDDRSSCPRTSPHRLTPSEVRAIADMVTSPEYRHVPTGTLAVLAQRLGTVSASPSTWYRLVRTYGWRRPRLRVHPAKPKVGLRTTGADEMWHIDTTVIRLLDGTRAYLHAVIDNFSRRILAWRVADTFAPVNSVVVLLEASRGAMRSASAPVVLADAGVENVNAQVDELIDTGVLRRLLAFTELKFSNSMIEAWWRSLKHQWLFLHSLEQRRDDPPAGGVLRPGTQPRASAFGVSRTDAGRDVLRHRGRGPDGPEVTRGRRASSTRGGQSIGVLRDVPVTQRGRMTPGRPPFRPRASRARALEATLGEPDRARSYE